MHEGQHGIIEAQHTHEHGHEHARTKSKSGLLVRYRKWLFPGFLLLTILAGLIPGQKELLGFDIALIPMLLGGGFITFNTIVAILETRRIGAGLLVVIALIGSAYVGEYLAAAVVAFMMIGGEFLEDLSLEKTRNAVRELVRLVPETARVFRSGEWVEVALEDVGPGDMVLVRPGERIPVDGKVSTGNAAVNQATLTGESMPVDKGPGDPVYVGTTNEAGTIEVVAAKVGEDTTFGRIIRIVYEAQEWKGKTQRVADRFAAYFTPVILAICVGVWFATGDLMRVMAVLVIACPCALVLATPTGVVAAVGNAARRGVMIKGGAVLELAGKVDTILFDKTGTLTLGRPEVVQITPFGAGDIRAIIGVAAAAEERSEHPIARAIRSRAGSEGISVARVEDFSQVFGMGVQASLDGQVIRVGNRRLLEQAALANADAGRVFIDEQERLGRTALLVSQGDELLGGISVADAIRPEAKEAIHRIHEVGVSRIVMLTGDNTETAENIAAQVGIAEVKANLLPEDKLKAVTELKSGGRLVAMVGDGVNDAPALMAADVGIAMGAAGTDVAFESAGIALMGDDLQMLSSILSLSRRTLGIIQQNIWVFAVGVNIIGISLSTAGWLSPIAAAVVHNIASVFVVLNSARLLTYRAPADRVPVK